MSSISVTYALLSRRAYAVSEFLLMASRICSAQGERFSGLIWPIEIIIFNGKGKG
jgi:hypothetical protein